MNERTAAEAMAANRLPLGRFVLDLVDGELLAADGGLAGLRRQALDVLLVLGRRAGQVVSKDEVMQRVWPGVVVGEGSLTQAIADVRRVLGDADHRLVRNVARRGYLLVPDGGAVAPPSIEPAWSGVDSARPPGTLSAGPAVAESAPARAPDGGAPATAAPTRPSSGRRALPVVALVALAMFIALGLTVAWLVMRPAAPAWQTPADLARAPLP